MFFANELNLYVILGLYINNKKVEQSRIDSKSFLRQKTVSKIAKMAKKHVFHVMDCKMVFHLIDCKTMFKNSLTVKFRKI